MSKEQEPITAPGWDRAIQRTEQVFNSWVTESMGLGAGALEVLDRVGEQPKSARPSGPMDWFKMAHEAHVTDEFPYLLAVALGKRFVDNFKSWQPAWGPFIGVESVSKLDASFSRIMLSEFRNWSEKSEGTEGDRDDLSEARYQLKATTWRSGFQFTRNAIINDDLGAWDKNVEKFIRSAQRTLDDRIAYTINANGAAYDAVTYYSSAAWATGHANSGTAALTADATGAAAVVAGCRAVIIQKDLDQRQVLGQAPKYLVAPTNVWDIGAILTDQQLVPNSGGTLDVVNQARKYGLQAIRWPALDTYDSNNWYLFCSPSDIASWVVTTLNGAIMPVINVKTTWRSVMGNVGGGITDIANAAVDIEFQGLLDFGVDDADPRGSYAGLVSGGTP